MRYNPLKTAYRGFAGLCTLTSEQTTPKGAVAGCRGAEVRRVMVRVHPLRLRVYPPLRLGVGLGAVPYPRVMCSKEQGTVQTKKERRRSAWAYEGRSRN